MLNKNGWGLREMLVLSGILILFLLIAVYYIYTMYDALEMEVSVKYYYDLEEKLENQARVYLSDYYDEVLTSDYVTITRSTLNAYDLDVNLFDNNGDACSGYVKANKSRGITNVDAYIKCKNYTTAGYEDWRE